MKRFFRWLFHDVFGWHRPGDGRGFDGLSWTAYCEICDKRLLQDSQGNWFLAARQESE